MSEPLRVALHHEAYFDVLRPVGELHMGTAPALRRTLSAALVDSGRVVADLDEMTLAIPAAGWVFPAALALAGGWPQARLAVAVPSKPDRVALEEQSITDLVPTCDNLTEAVRLLDSRPPLVRRQVWLDLDASAVMRAQMFVELACRDWGLTERHQLDGVARVAIMLFRAGDIRVDGTIAATVSLSTELGPQGLAITARAWLGSATPSRTGLTHDEKIHLTHHRDGVSFTTHLPCQ